MSIASLTIDLVMNLAKFEGDSGKAAAIVARDADKMTKAQTAFLRSTERLAERVGKTQADYLRVRAAILGVSDAAEKSISLIEGVGGSSTRAASQSAAAFVGMGAAAVGAVDKEKAAMAELVASIQQVSAATAKRRAELIAEESAGKITPAQLKTSLSGLSTTHADSIRALEDYARQEAAAREAAATEKTAVDKRRASLATLNDSLNGVTAAYRRNLQVLQESLKSGDISPKQFQVGLAKLNQQQNPSIIRFREEQAAAEKAAEAIEQSAARKVAAEQAATATFVESIQRQANAIGKSRAELLAEEAERRGVTAQLQPYISKLSEAEKNLNKFGRTTGITKYELQTLHYTLSDVVASLASGIPVTTILLQQGGQVRDVFGSFGNVARGLLSLLTPTRVALGGVAAGAALLALAYRGGAEESRAFRDSQVLTNNAIGITEGQFNALVVTLGTARDVTRGAARDIGQALASTGEIGPRNIQLASEAGARYAKATNQNAGEVAKDFAGMQQGVAKWAVEHNRSLNFVTVGQYAFIKQLEQQGRTEEAAAVVLEALNTRLKGLHSNLGYIESSLERGKKLWSDWWDAAKGVGRETTVEDRLDFIRKKIDIRAVTPALPGTQANRDKGDARLQEESNLQSRRVLREQENAFAQGEANVDEKRAIAAKDFVDHLRDEAKGVDVVTKKVAEAQRQFDALKGRKDVTGKSLEIPEDEQRRMLDFIRRSANPEGDQTRKAQLQQTLKLLTDELQSERDALTFHQAFLSGAYSAAEVSLQTFYDERRAANERALGDELSVYEREIKALQDYLKKTTDPSDRVATQQKIDEAKDKATRAREQGARTRILTNQEEAASFKDLGDKVVEFQATLKQLAGDEAGAAQLRAINAIENARRFSVQSGGKVSAEDVSRLKELTRISNDYAEVQRKVGIATERAANAEELFALRAQQSGKSLIDTERGVFAIRAQELDELAKLRDEQVKLAAASAAANNGIADPKILAYVAELTLRYEKLRDTIDPALNRLRQATESLGASLAQTFSQSLAGFDQLYSARRDSANKDAASQRDDYDKRLQQLYGYLAKAQDAQARAAIQAEITRVKGERARVGESKTSTLLKTVERDVLGPMLRQIEQTAVKLLVQDPLDALFKSTLRQLTEGDNFIGNFLKDTLKIGAKAVDPEAIAKQALVTATTQQTTAVGEATLTQYQATEALDLMTDAAYEAADALLEISASGGGGGGGGLLGSLGSFFGGSSGAGSGLEGMSPEDLSYFFGGHGGGVAGYFGSPIKARASDFSGAPRYHSGGVVGLQPDEVASILRRGEEVITRADPRHRWNSGKGGGGAASMPVYLSINNNGAPVETKSKTATQTDRGLLVELVIDTIKNDADNGGPATRAIAGRLGGNTAAGVPRRGRAGF